MWEGEEPVKPKRTLGIGVPEESCSVPASFLIIANDEIQLGSNNDFISTMLNFKGQRTRHSRHLVNSYFHVQL